MSPLKTHTLLLLRRAGITASFGGRFRAPRSVLWYVLRRVHVTIPITDFDGDLSLDLSLSEHMQRRIFWMGYYNLQIIPFIKTVLRPGMICIDIGANIGEISMVAAKCVGARGRVISFEPIDSIADELQSNVLRNHFDQISISRIALSDSTDNDVPIYASRGRRQTGDENRGLGSLLGAASGQAPLQNVSTTTLDAWLCSNPVDHVDMIKIDIEGAELPCLKGAEHTLRTFKPMLIIEVQNTTANTAGYRARDILDYLAGIGYMFKRFERHGLSAEIGVDDLLSTQNVLCLPVNAVNASSRGTQ